MILLDTHLVIWAATANQRLPAAAREAIGDPATRVAFSVISLWEIAIKSARRRSDFAHAPASLREAALRAGWEELPVLARHALEVANLPPIHADPFDRLLVAQARAEGLPLLSADRTLARYGDPVRLV